MVDLIATAPTSVSRSAIGEHREWAGAVAEAKQHRKDRLPDFAYTFAGHTSGARLPTHITWQDAFALADWWMNTIGDEELMRADTQQALREIAEEDAAVEAEVREQTPANEPAQRKATKPRRAKRKR